jgi:diaminopimelate epimerase
MSLAFCKWQAFGNDFILVESQPNHDIIKAIPRLCHRRLGVGADGFIFLELGSTCSKLHFYNQDGSKASMCGNGLRCALLHLATKDLKAAVDFSGTRYEAFFEEGKMFVNMPYPKIKNTFHDPYLGILVDAGVPHFLVEKSSCHEGQLSDQVFLDRAHPNFDEEGANITFYEKKDGKYFIRTCERGVAEETWACGSAACAVAILEDSPSLEVVYPSGQSAYIKKDKKQLFLAGEATLSFVGIFEI